MPKETFWSATSVENDGSLPVLTVSWGQHTPEVFEAGVSINGMDFDLSGLKRLIRVLCKARNQTEGRNV
jgi:hypothetical protein